MWKTIKEEWPIIKEMFLEQFQLNPLALRRAVPKTQPSLFFVDEDGRMWYDDTTIH